MSTPNNSTYSDTPIIYHPEYDINNGVYVDYCPIHPRITSKYICYCSGGGKVFKNRTEYSYHIKLKSHRLYIDHYSERINNLDSAKDYIKNILIKNKALEKEVAQLKYELSQNKKELNKQDFETKVDVD
jgi:hypothetical protein